MKTTKRFLSIVLMLAMLVSMFTVMAFAGAEPNGENTNAEEYYVKIKVEGSNSGANGYAAINETKYTSEQEQKVEFNSWNALNQAYLSVLSASDYEAAVSVDKSGLSLSANGGNLSGAFNGATITVKFEKKTSGGETPPQPSTTKHNVYVVVDGNGTGTVTSDNTKVGNVIELGDSETKTLTATPDNGCTVSWKLHNGEKEGTASTASESTATIELKASDLKGTNALLTITFSKNESGSTTEERTLTVSAGRHGQISLDKGDLKASDSKKLKKDDKFTVKAVADTGYHFVKWEAKGIRLTADEAKNLTLNLTMPDNEVKLTATFERDDYYYGDDKLYIDITNASRGTVKFLNDNNVADGKDFWLEDGETYTIYATADRGYTAYWRYNGVWDYGRSFTFEMDEDCNKLYVEFVKDGYRPSRDDSHTLTIDITGEKHGTVKRGTTKIYDGYTMSLDKNDTRTFKATPDKGYVTVWTFGGESYVGNEFTVKMGSKNATLYIEFMDEDDYRLWNLPFRDVSERDWFYSDVAYVYANGYMEGISSTKFAPNQNTTRAQIVTILWRLTGEPRATKSNKFNDVSSSAYYDKAVSWAVEAGVVNGFDAKTFKPNDYVTREQLAAILYRYAEYMNLSTRGASNLTKYDDYYQIGTWARDAMEWANYHGLINGVSYTRIDPKGLATRAQVAAILHRFAVEFGNY